MPMIPDYSPSLHLHTSYGLSAMLNEGGTAVVNDLSAVDNNPSGLAASKEFAFSGGIDWNQRGLASYEAGVLDSTLAEVAAGLKVRQTTKSSGMVDRRYSLGFGERMGESPLLLGIAGDYLQLSKRDPGTSGEIEDNLSLRLGALYNLAEGVTLGASSSGYFDKHLPKRHALGAAFILNSYYVLNGDLLFERTSLRRMTLGATVMAKGYLDLRLSYGYEQARSRHLFSGGVVVQSQHARLFYAASRNDPGGEGWRHTLGATFLLNL